VLLLHRRTHRARLTLNSAVFQPVKRQRLHEAIAEHLEEMVLRGQFRPGEPLPTESDLATQLAVSRAVVRDAVRVLATKGLVHVRHGVGAFVTDSGRARLAEALGISLRRGDYTPWELYIIRRGLELTVVEEAIERATAEQIAEMRRVMADYRVHYFEDPQRGFDEHVRFHQLMARSTGNRILVDLLDPITVFRIPEHLGTAGLPRTDTPELHEDYCCRHERIVDAIEKRDLAEARVAMLEHIADLEGRARRATEELEYMKRDGD